MTVIYDFTNNNDVIVSDEKSIEVPEEINSPSTAIAKIVGNNLNGNTVCKMWQPQISFYEIDKTNIGTPDAILKMLTLDNSRSPVSINLKNYIIDTNSFNFSVNSIDENNAIGEEISNFGTNTATYQDQTVYEFDTSIAVNLRYFEKFALKFTVINTSNITNDSPKELVIRFLCKQRNLQNTKTFEKWAAITIQDSSTLGGITFTWL